MALLPKRDVGYNLAKGALVIAALLVILAPGANAAPVGTPSYSVSVIVQMSPTNTTTPVGIAVNFTNVATDQACGGSTSPGGFVTFTSASCPALTAGWWRATLPPQQFTISPGHVWFVAPPNSTGVIVALGQPTGTTVTVTLSGVTMTQASSSIFGSVLNVVPGSQYHIDLLDPTFPGYLVASTAATAPMIVTRPGLGGSANTARPAPRGTALTLNFSVTGPCEILFNGAPYYNGGSASVESGLQYSIVAEACSGWAFLSWTSTAGALGSPSSSSTTITMTSNGTLYANYTTQTCSFAIADVPMGVWTLYAFGVTPTSSGYDYYNYTSVTVDRMVAWKNVSLTGYLVFGDYVTPSGTYDSNSNITIWDATTHEVYPSYVAASGSAYYRAGLYSGDMGTTGGNQSFVVFYSPQGYNSTWRNLTVNPAKPAVQYNPSVRPGTSSVFDTTITFGNFSSVSVSSEARMGAGSTFAQLPNASIGNLWAQLGLDFNNSNPSVDQSAWQSFHKWLVSEGPVYSAESEGLAVNGTLFHDDGNYSMTTGSYAFPGNESYYSTAGMSYETFRNYTLTPWAFKNASSYVLSVGFNYPTSSESMNYTVNLPRGYTLENGTLAPKGTSVIPSGPVGPGGNLWTSFTIIPHQYDIAHGIGNFTIYRISNVTAIVNVTSSDFAFTSRNVWNATNGNYTVLVGAGNNVSLTASHSLVSATVNVTNYEWNFSSSPATTCLTKGQPGYLTAMCVNTASTSINHYFDQGGVVHGSLTLLTSGGESDSTTFTVYVDNIQPIPLITTNNTHVISINTVTRYLYVNWSTSLQLNATGSTDAINGSLPLRVNNGTIAVADWNITAGQTYHNANYSLSRGSKAFTNLSYQFLGAGPYEKGSVIVDGRVLSLNGWLYNVSLTLWDAGGLRAMANMYVLVNDTERPVALGSVQNALGRNVTGGLVVGENGTVQIGLLENYSFDPHNGSIVSYSWSVTNDAGAFVKGHAISSTERAYWNSTTPQRWGVYLAASVGAYNFTLNVTDLAGNHGLDTYPVIVSYTGLGPIVTVTNLTALPSWTDGSEVTIWVDVTNSGYSTTVANNVSVQFYLTNPNGTDKTIIGGSPADVLWYGFSNNVVNTTASYTGVLPSMLSNQTWRAEITYTPPSSMTGTRWLWANATAANELAVGYRSGVNVIHIVVTVGSASPSFLFTALLVVIVAIVIGVAVIFIRSRKRVSGESAKPAEKAPPTGLTSTETSTTTPNVSPPPAAAPASQAPPAITSGTAALSPSRSSVPPRFCQYCGTPNDEDAVICKACGKRLPVGK
jgi:hypothetical protein